MIRFSLFAAVAAMSALAAVAPPSLAQHRGYERVDRLDEAGKPFGASWTPVDRFDSITAASMDDVHVTTGPRWQIRASGDPRALRQLRFLVEKNGLIVGRISGPRERYAKVRIDITAPSLEGATTAGSGSLEVDRLSGPSASAVVAGSGQATIGSLATERFRATIAGSGGLRVAGTANSSSLTIAGSGSLVGNGFVTRRANVTVAGSGSAQFRATGPVRANLVGSGNVSVVGTTDCSQTRMGSGRLICRR